MTVETRDIHLVTNGPRYQVRFSLAQREALQRIADRRGCTVADVIREACISAFSLPTRGSETSTVIVSTDAEQASIRENPYGDNDTGSSVAGVVSNGSTSQDAR